MFSTGDINTFLKLYILFYADESVVAVESAVEKGLNYMQVMKSGR